MRHKTWVLQSCGSGFLGSGFDKKLHLTHIQATGEDFSPQKRISSTMFVGQFCPPGSGYLSRDPTPEEFRISIHLIRVRIQHPNQIRIKFGSIVFMTKNWKKCTGENFFIFLDQTTITYLSLGLHKLYKGRLSYKTHKRTSSTCKHEIS